MGFWEGLLYVDLLALAAVGVIAVLAVLSWRLGGGERARVATTTFELASRIPRSRWLIAVVPGAMAITVILGYAAQPQAVHGERILLVVPLTAAIIAVMILTWTTGARFDAGARRVSQWRGPKIGIRVFAFGERATPVPADAHVELDEKFHSTGKGGGYYLFAVAIDKIGTIIEERDADVARLHAERIAKTFGLDLVDKTSADDVTLTRPRAELDMPLADQLRLRGKTEARPPLPEHSRFVLESEELPWVVRVPPKGLRGSDIAVLVIAAPFIFMVAMVPAFILIAIVADRVSSSVFGLSALIGAATHWFTVARVMLRARRETQLVKLSPSGIRVLRRSPGRSTANELPAERIEEIVIVHNRESYSAGLVVIARGDGVSIEAGHGVNAADAAWLRQVMLAALAPPSLYR